MDKSQIFMKIAELPERSPVLERIARELEPTLASPEIKLFTFVELSRRIGISQSWLWRLGVTKTCGRQIAGHKRYDPAQVLEFLGSSECRERLKEIRESRQPAGQKHLV